MGKPLIDLTGQRFGKLTVIEIGEKRGKSTRAFWLCRCDCGNYTTVGSDRLRGGKTQSCGCLQKERASEARKKPGKHRNIIYIKWSDMLERCYNHTCDMYYRYGGRGITVCDEWKNDFQAFYDWSMKNGYEEGLTIDRIDVDGNYEPSNCRWATLKEQANNKSNNHLITYNGETHTMAEWAEIKGIPYLTLSQRINGQKWAIEKALNEPINPFNQRLITYNGESHSMREWSRITGINYKTLSTRINQKHWPIEKALTEPVKHK